MVIGCYGRHMMFYFTVKGQQQNRIPGINLATYGRHPQMQRAWSNTADDGRGSFKKSSYNRTKPGVAARGAATNRTGDKVYQSRRPPPVLNRRRDQSDRRGGGPEGAVRRPGRSKAQASSTLWNCMVETSCQCQALAVMSQNPGPVARSSNVWP